jgi:hypothetical protein
MTFEHAQSQGRGGTFLPRVVQKSALLLPAAP